MAALAPLSIDEVEALADPTVPDEEVVDAINAVEAEAEELEAQFAEEAAAEPAAIDEETLAEVDAEASPLDPDEEEAER
ncbi:MAG: hypothetical protein QM679_04525 [Patulibacter sp.]